MSVNGVKVKTAARAGIDKRRMQLPFSKAVEISLKSIRIRFWRSVITAAGIFLGIAFFSSVRMSATFSQIQDRIITEKRIAIEQGSLKPTAEDTRQILSASLSAADRRSAADRLEWLSIMALIVCTVGITNAMLMSVTERYKEIGTMKCLGALDSFIVKLFFIESCLLGLIASVLGFVAGWLVISLVHLIGDGTVVFGGQFWRSSGVLGVEAAAIGTFLTFIATIFPAIRAAQMPPAAALRVEI